MLGTPLHASMAGPGVSASRTSRILRSGNNKALDVSYVTPRLCVVGFPWRGRTERRARRNNIDAVSEFIEAQHTGHYMVWNLTAAGSYDYSKFGNKGLSRTARGAEGWRRTGGEFAPHPTRGEHPHGTNACSITAGARRGQRERGRRGELPGRAGD